MTATIMTLGLGLLWLAGLPVTIDDAAGQRTSSELVSLDDQHVTISQASGAPTQLPLAQIRRIEAAAPTSQPSGDADLPWRVELADGTLWRVARYEVQGPTAVLHGLAQDKWQIPVSQVVAVRRVQLPEAQEATWQAAQTPNPTTPTVGDTVMVVRKNGTLDAITGRLQNTTADGIQFQFDDETLDVKWAKLAGIRYFRPASDGLAAPRGQLSLIDGSRIPFVRLRLDDHGTHLVGQTPLGLEFNRPLATLRQLDLAQLSLVYLSDLEPERVEWKAFWDVGAVQASLETWFAYRRDRRFPGGKLRLPVAGVEQVWEKGLSLHSHTEMAYRLAGEYRRLIGWVGLDPSLDAGQVRLVVQGDGRTLAETVVVAGADAQPWDLDLTGVKRLTILADYGDGSDIGDRVVLGDARLIK